MTRHVIRPRNKMAHGCGLLFLLLFMTIVGITQGDPVEAERLSNGLDIFSMTQDVKEDARCVMCKFFVQKLHDYLVDSPIISLFNSSVMSECIKYIKVEFLCKMLIDVLDSELMNVLNKELIPNYACPAAGFCPKAGEPFFLQLSDSKEGPNRALCELCRYSAHESTKLVDQLLELGDIKNKMTAFCYSKIDAKICPEVTDMQIMFFKAKLLEGPLDPDELCTTDLYIC